MQDKIRVESAWFQRLNLIYDKLLSTFAFNGNVRPCIMAGSEEDTIAAVVVAGGMPQWYLALMSERFLDLCDAKVGGVQKRAYLDAAGRASPNLLWALRVMVAGRPRTPRSLSSSTCRPQPLCPLKPVVPFPA